MPAEKSSYNLREKTGVGSSSTSSPYSDKSKQLTNKGSSAANKKGPASPTSPMSPTKSQQKASSASKKSQNASPTSMRPKSPIKKLRDDIINQVHQHGQAIQKILPNHITPKVSHTTVVAGSPTSSQSATASPVKSSAHSDERLHRNRSTSPTKRSTRDPTAATLSGSSLHDNNHIVGSPSKHKDAAFSMKQEVVGMHTTASPLHQQNIGSPTKHANTTPALQNNMNSLSQAMGMPKKQDNGGSPSKPDVHSPVKHSSGTKIPVQQTASVGKAQSTAKMSADQLKKGLAHTGAIPATPKSPSK